MVRTLEPRGEAVERHLIIRPIGPDQVSQAYPLVRAIEPGLTLERWQAHVQALAAGSRRQGARGGVMSLQDAQGYIHGLFGYEVTDDPRCGRTLRVDTVVSFHLGAAEETAQRVLRAIETVARQNGCSAVQVDMPVEDAPCLHRPGMVVSDLEGAGYRRVSVTWCKRIPARGGPPGGALDP